MQHKKPSRRITTNFHSGPTPVSHSSTFGFGWPWCGVPQKVIPLLHPHIFFHQLQTPPSLLRIPWQGTPTSLHSWIPDSFMPHNVLVLPISFLAGKTPLFVPLRISLIHLHHAYSHSSLKLLFALLFIPLHISLIQTVQGPIPFTHRLVSNTSMVYSILPVYINWKTRFIRTIPSRPTNDPLIHFHSLMDKRWSLKDQLWVSSQASELIPQLIYAILDSTMAKACSVGPTTFL
jgi:hypothetical protein